MKLLFLALAITLSLNACICEGDEEIVPQCSTRATMRDLTGLDGCGFVLELEDGSKLEPAARFWCGTPPYPEEQEKASLPTIEWVDGKKVMIDYEVVEGHVSICMVGQGAYITCISEIHNDGHPETAE